MPEINSGLAYYLGDTPVQKLYAGDVHVWPFAPKPTVTSVSPTEYHHLDGVVQMTVNGTGFMPTSQIFLNGVLQGGFVYVSPTQVKVNVDPNNTGTADLSWWVMARNPAPGGGDSTDPVNITVVPEPTLASISPTQRETDDPVTTITFTGTNFTPECKVMSGTTVMSGSTYVNRTTMTAIDGQATVTTVTLHVEDERGHKTVTKEFKIVSPPPPPGPTVTSADGWQGVWGAGYDGVINVYGTNFVAPMTVEIDNDLCGGGPFSASATVHSSTHCSCDADKGQVLVHNSSTSTDNSHIVRVTTPNGTSAWSSGQPVAIN
jgi:hypothetical protein